ncbi:MAG: histidine kinase [Rhodothermales bacterium]
MTGAVHDISDTPADRRRNIWLQAAAIFGFWTLLAVLTAGGRVIDPFNPDQTTAEALREAGPVFINYYLWAFLTPLIFWFAGRFNVERDNWMARVPLHVAAALIVAISVDLYDDAIRLTFFDRPMPFDPLRALTSFWFFNELITYAAVLAAGFAREFFIRYQARQKETMELRAQADRLQAQLSEARLQALRMQINPHFLFNTLHAVSSLVERDPQGVRRMLARLSELLRYTLEDGTETEVPLQQEINFLDRYLEIQRIRFQDRLDVKKDIAPDVVDALIPNLILQPIVENAIKHGASKVRGIGRVSIRARRENDRLIVSIADNGPGLEGDSIPEEDRGFGLRNTRERLEELYGGAFELSFMSPEGGGLVAEVVLPYHTRADIPAAKRTDTADIDTNA